jgi:hypothetical protein
MERVYKYLDDAKQAPLTPPPIPKEREVPVSKKIEAVDPSMYWHYRDLLAKGIVGNRVTLARWIAIGGFPKPVSLGPNTRAWLRTAVETWLESRAHPADDPAPVAADGHRTRRGSR